MQQLRIVFLVVVLSSCSPGEKQERPSAFDRFEKDNRTQPLADSQIPSAHSDIRSSDQPFGTIFLQKCGNNRVTCVVDGDTLWLNGVKIRVADIDTPEISQPKCEEERALGNAATERLISLLNKGPFDLKTIDNRDEDRYGRKLRVLTRNGRSIGEQLVAEGLARTWTGKREPWCI